jgi:hypothetical protein
MSPESIAKHAHAALDEAEAYARQYEDATTRLASLEREHTAARYAAEDRLQESQGWSATKAEKMVKMDPEFLAHIIMEDDAKAEARKLENLTRHTFERARIYRTQLAVMTGAPA